MIAWLRRQERWVEPAVVALGVLWIAVFFYLQLDGLRDPWVLEWDARAVTLPAWRYHGSGLFPNDFLVDFAAVYLPPLTKVVYWIGTLFTDPLTVSKWVPIALGAYVTWQCYQLGRHLGGRALGVGAAVLILHCNFVWGRLVGLTARAYAFPIIFTFLHLVVARRERSVLALLLVSTLLYPSAFLVCAPAYGMLILLEAVQTRTFDRRRWLRYGATLAGAFGLLAVTALRPDPRVGHPILYKELETLLQRGIVGMWPQPPAEWVVRLAVKVAAYDDFGPVLWARRWAPRQSGLILVVTALLMALLAGRRLRRIHPVFPAFLIATVAAFAVAQSFPYRLYLPDRVLLYGAPPLLLIGLLQLAHLGMSRLTERHAGVLATLLVCTLELGFYGTGLTRGIGLHDWRNRNTPVVGFAATLPKDVTIAAPFDVASNIQAFARRQVLFSSILNTPIYYPSGVELERRIKVFYRAYYAHDWAPVRTLMNDEHIDYIVVDERDFGPSAVARAQYAMWTPFFRQLLFAAPLEKLVWRAPPPNAIVFRDGQTLVIDLHKL
jgi:hypothetical protein